VGFSLVPTGVLPREGQNRYTSAAMMRAAPITVVTSGLSPNTSQAHKVLKIGSTSVMRPASEAVTICRPRVMSR
jgi:hypothetical protein